MVTLLTATCKKKNSDHLTKSHGCLTKRWTLFKIIWFNPCIMNTSFHSIVSKSSVQASFRVLLPSDKPPIIRRYGCSPNPKQHAACSTLPQGQGSPPFRLNFWNSYFKHKNYNNIIIIHVILMIYWLDYIVSSIGYILIVVMHRNNTEQ